MPVFTNFPENKVLNSKDSVLLNDVKTTAEFILNDPFWMAQTAQIDITQQHNFEMIPTVGNHLVRLGNGDNIEKKFHRLFVFYTQVMTKTGFDKYSSLDVEYAGQVIGTRRGTTSIADTAQLRLNIERLLQQSQQIQFDTTVFANPVVEKSIPANDAGITKINANSKLPIPPKMVSNTTMNEKKKPKAVMGKRQ